MSASSKVARNGTLESRFFDAYSGIKLVQINHAVLNPLRRMICHIEWNAAFVDDGNVPRRALARNLYGRDANLQNVLTIRFRANSRQEVFFECAAGYSLFYLKSGLRFTSRDRRSENALAVIAPRDRLRILVISSIRTFFASDCNRATSFSVHCRGRGLLIGALSHSPRIAGPEWF